MTDSSPFPTLEEPDEVIEESPTNQIETAAQYVALYEQNVSELADVIWRAVVDANQQGLFVNIAVFAGAQAEVSLRIIAAQARSSEENLERFRKALGI
jgi:hypothetical protein